MSKRAKRKISLSPLSVGRCFEMKHRGFTLIELCITMAILLFTAMVAIPAVQKILTETRNATVKASLAELRAAIHSYSAREIAAGRASRFGTGAEGGWPTVDQINEAKYGGSNIVLPGRDVPENPWAKFVFTQDFDLVVLTYNSPGDGAYSALWDGSSAYADPPEPFEGDLPPDPMPPVYSSVPGGWNYNESTGQIWARTSANGESVTENQF